MMISRVCIRLVELEDVFFAEEFVEVELSGGDGSPVEAYQTLQNMKLTHGEAQGVAEGDGSGLA